MSRYTAAEEEVGRLLGVGDWPSLRVVVSADLPGWLVAKVERTGGDRSSGLVLLKPGAPVESAVVVMTITHFTAWGRR